MKLSLSAGLMAMLAVCQSVHAIWFPVSTPSSTSPWIIGGNNAVSWIMGGDTGVTAFDIQMHNLNKTIMTGFVPIAQAVPVRKFTSGTKKGIYGGEMAISLTSNMPTGDGFILVFMDTVAGIVYARSEKFTIYPASAQPSNYSEPTLPSGSAATTIALTESPNPEQHYATTLDGTAKTATVTATSVAGQVGN